MPPGGSLPLTEVIDLHCHLLPGLDDGPGSMREAVAMARALAGAGATAVACTPHMHPRYPTRPARVHDGVAELQSRLDEEGVPLRLYPAGEISLEHLPRMSPADLAMACLGDGPWLLVEMPFQGWPINLAETVRDLELRGHRVLLAHPERSEAVQRAPDRLRDIVGRGALLQVTAASFLGDNGPVAQRTAVALLASGTAHIMASDAHSAGPWRPPGVEEGLAEAARATGADPGVLRWMVEDGPAAIVEGRPVRPPQLTPSRRLREAARPAPSGRRSRSRG